MDDITNWKENISLIQETHLFDSEKKNLLSTIYNRKRSLRSGPKEMTVYIK